MEDPFNFKKLHKICKLHIVNLKICHQNQKEHTQLWNLTENRSFRIPGNIGNTRAQIEEVSVEERHLPSGPIRRKILTAKMNNTTHII